MALTDTAIKRSRPGDKPYKLADGKGLYLLVNPSLVRTNPRTLLQVEASECIAALATESVTLS
jgi:hypothetical protein